MTGTTTQNTRSASDHFIQFAETLGFGELHIKTDPETGLRAVIALHSTKRGPAIGGCRFIHYEQFDDAILDALRLAQMMSFKAAFAKLPHGGGKAVLMKPDVLPDRQQHFEAFGRFVNELHGRYITAVDSGTSPDDMDMVSKQTEHVLCTSPNTSQQAGDASAFTALGVCRGIESAVKFKLQQPSLAGIHVLIQGAGNVGYHLTKELIERQAKVTLCDVDSSHIQRCTEDFDVSVVEPERIFASEYDVYAPCALGGTLNENTINDLRAPIIAGSANNQLADLNIGAELHKRDMLYAPDFVINAGGLICAAAMHNNSSMEKAHQDTLDIYDSLEKLFNRSRERNRPTSVVAHNMAKEILAGSENL